MPTQPTEAPAAGSAHQPCGHHPDARWPRSPGVDPALSASGLARIGCVASRRIDAAAV